MVCLTHEKHDLSDSGITHFPDWFKQLTNLLISQPGFISICYAQDPDEQSSMHTWIEFKDQDHLKKWLASPSYAAIHKQLEHHRIRPHHMTHFKVVDAVSAPH